MTGGAGSGWEGTLGRAAAGAITAFALAAFPTYVSMKSVQDQNSSAIARIDSKVNEMDRNGPRAMDVVKAKVDGLDKKLDELVDLLRAQNEMLNRRGR